MSRVQRGAGGGCEYLRAHWIGVARWLREARRDSIAELKMDSSELGRFNGRWLTIQIFTELPRSTFGIRRTAGG